MSIVKVYKSALFWRKTRKLTLAGFNLRRSSTIRPARENPLSHGTLVPGIGSRVSAILERRGNLEVASSQNFIGSTLLITLSPLYIFSSFDMLATTAWLEVSGQSDSSYSHIVDNKKSENGVFAFALLHQRLFTGIRWIHRRWVLIADQRRQQRVGKKLLPGLFKKFQSLILVMYVAEVFETRIE